MRFTIFVTVGITTFCRKFGSITVSGEENNGRMWVCYIQLFRQFSNCGRLTVQFVAQGTAQGTAQGAALPFCGMLPSISSKRKP